MAKTFQPFNSSLLQTIAQILQSAHNYWVSQQNNDGCWGGQKGVEGSIEETALAVSALHAFNREAAIKGLAWLENEVQTHGITSKPIGLYFAMLWYDEKLYPLIFYVEALRKMKYTHKGSWNIFVECVPQPFRL